jgi:hypothetical protein
MNAAERATFQDFVCLASIPPNVGSFKFVDCDSLGRSLNTESQIIEKTIKICLERNRLKLKKTKEGMVCRIVKYYKYQVFRDVNIEDKINELNVNHKRDFPLSIYISYDFSSRSWKNIREEEKKAWAEAYPACDIDLCLSQMAAWLDANPKKAKKRYGPFIVNWLSREQQRGGMTKRGREIGNRPAGSALPEYMKGAAAEHDRLKKAGKI